MLPHPRLADRPFVLVPLAELEPYWVHPELGLSVSELLGRFPSLDGVRWWRPSPKCVEVSS